MKSPAPIASAAQSSVAEQKRGFAILDSERWLGPLLIGPAVIYIFLLVGVPFFMALYYSVSNTTSGGGTMGFVGLRNFSGVIGTPKFQTALKNTIIFGLISQALILVLSNALALALQHEFPGRRLIRFLILLPWVAQLAAETGAYMLGQLQELLRYPVVAEVRGLGLAVAVDLCRDRDSKTPFEPVGIAGQMVYEAALKAGVIVRPGGDTIMIRPPLVLTRHEVDKLVAALAAGIRQVQEQVR